MLESYHKFPENIEERPAFSLGWVTTELNQQGGTELIQETEAV